MAAPRRAAPAGTPAEQGMLGPTPGVRVARPAQAEWAEVAAPRRVVVLEARELFSPEVVAPAPVAALAAVA